MIIDLIKLFEGYVRNYHTLSLTVYDDNQSIKRNEMEYFTKLGSMVGYQPYTMDTCDEIYGTMGLTWWDNNTNIHWNDFVLQVEREYIVENDQITLEKLFSERTYIPTNVIGIINVCNQERVYELIRITKQICNIKNALLVFKTRSTKSNHSICDTILAYLINENKIVTLQTAYVKDSSGNLFMDFKKETGQ
ncbi:hypothetical protein [Aquibacillus rhizosphaerae]|uniref:Uncharacterized protein n=1 Tax=Aquibacillus rhizosphaerae TaxID=3051431 RepID=A0ABT7L9Y2_9BACI|nr:hypothetical protein [Aquibacillus sp. LR5S19]MDL4842683.1 hypothetical protein [Aquibacillus sp. LR5S19]